MSLEDAINANTKAVTANTALLEKMMASAPKVGETVAGKAPATTTPATKTPTTTSKPAVKKKAETTSEHVAERVKSYLKGGDESERATRKGHVGAIIGHYGVDRFTAIDPSDFDTALGYMDAFAEGENPFADGDDGAGEGQQDEDGIV